MARVTHLATGALSLLGTVYTKNYSDIRFEFEVEEEDGRGVGERYGDPVIVKSRMNFGGSFMRTTSGVRRSMLDMTVMSLDGSSILGRMKGGSLNIRTEVDEGSGGGDRDEYDEPTGTTIEGSADLQIASAAEFTAIMAAADNLAQLVMTQAGFSATIPIQINRAAHMDERLKIQTETVSFSGKGSTALVATGDPVLVSAITGTALGAFSFNSGANTYSAAGGCIVLSAGVTWADKAIIKDQFECKARGLATVTGPV